MSRRSRLVFQIQLKKFVTPSSPVFLRMSGAFVMRPVAAVWFVTWLVTGALTPLRTVSSISRFETKGSDTVTYRLPLAANTPTLTATEPTVSHIHITIRRFDTDKLWRLPIYVGLFHPTRELLIAAPTRYHAACIADQIITDDEWFPSFSAEPVDSEDALLLALATIGSDPR